MVSSLPHKLLTISTVSKGFTQVHLFVFWIATLSSFCFNTNNFQISRTTVLLQHEVSITPTNPCLPYKLLTVFMPNVSFSLSALDFFFEVHTVPFLTRKHIFCTSFILLVSQCLHSRYTHAIIFSAVNNDSHTYILLPHVYSRLQKRPLTATQTTHNPHTSCALLPRVHACLLDRHAAPCLPHIQVISTPHME